MILGVRLIMCAQDKILDNGIAIYGGESSPLTEEDWASFKMLCSPNRLEYVYGSVGDRGEKTSVVYFRFKTTKSKDYSCERIEKLLNQPKFLNFLRQETGIKDPYIDRAQVHIYSEGSFLEKHRDAETDSRYTHAVLMLLSDEYEGGEFVVHHPKKGQISTKPLKNTIAITACDMPHEVKPIIVGKRQSLVFFLMEKSELQ